jgi:hypothetical protein
MSHDHGSGEGYDGSGSLKICYGMMTLGGICVLSNCDSDEEGIVRIWFFLHGGGRAMFGVLGARRADYCFLRHNGLEVQI